KRREQAKELLEQSPALGFAAAHAGEFRRSELEPEDIAARLSRRRQREIAGWLGFPASQAWANILAKIPAEIVGLDALLALRDAAENPALERLLCQVHGINAGVLALEGDRDVLALVTPKLLEEVVEAPEEKTRPQVAHLISEIVNLRSLMDVDGVASAFRSIAEVRRKQQDAAEQFVRFLKQLAGPRFPDPPLPGTEQIIPLVNA